MLTCVTPCFLFVASGMAEKLRFRGLMMGKSQSRRLMKAKEEFAGVANNSYVLQKKQHQMVP